MLCSVLIAGAEVEEDALFLAGEQGELLMQCAAGIAARAEAAGELALLHADGVTLGMVCADERIPLTVEAIRVKAGGEELPAVFLIMIFAQRRTVPVLGAGSVQAHLEVLLIHFNMVEGELHVAEHAEGTRCVGVIAQAHVKDFDGIITAAFAGDEQGLAGLNAIVVAGVGGVAEAVAAGVIRLCQRFTGGLPRDGPEVTVLVVAQIDVMAGPIHGHAVGTEPGDAVVLRRVQPAIPARVMGQHSAHSLRPQIVRHRKRSVNPLHDVLPLLVIKIPVSHKIPPYIEGVIARERPFLKKSPLPRAPSSKDEVG